MITPENYEGWLMRYADGELTAAERRQVEAFLAEHPDLREELDEVRSVRVAPLVATMPGKERLLRREPAAVWRRVAAAAALLVVAGTTLFFLNRPAEGEMIAELPASTDTPASPPAPLQASPPAPLPQERGVDSIVDRARPASPQAAEKYLAEAATDAPHNPENPEKLERLEYLVELERLDNLAKLDSPDTLEAPPAPAPGPTATLGIVVEDARLASNPWRQLLAFND
ncbi:MAG: hypothetical protein SPL12_00760 [Bacteroidales bacterium]|nr:hypothetical protein [Bacteroidales bacterium]